MKIHVCSWIDIKFVTKYIHMKCICCSSCVQHAKELMAAAATRGGLQFSFKHEQGKILRELEAAQKDNDFIYHDIIPDVKSLPALGKTAVAKPLPVPEKFSANFIGKMCSYIEERLMFPVF